MPRRRVQGSRPREATGGRKKIYAWAGRARFRARPPCTLRCGRRRLCGCRPPSQALSPGLIRLFVNPGASRWTLALPPGENGATSACAHRTSAGWRQRVRPHRGGRRKLGSVSALLHGSAVRRPARSEGGASGIKGSVRRTDRWEGGGHRVWRGWLSKERDACAGHDR